MASKANSQVLKETALRWEFFWAGKQTDRIGLDCSVCVCSTPLDGLLSVFAFALGWPFAMLQVLLERTSVRGNKQGNAWQANRPEACRRRMRQTSRKCCKAACKLEWPLSCKFKATKMAENKQAATRRAAAAAAAGTLTGRVAITHTLRKPDKSWTELSMPSTCVSLWIMCLCARPSHKQMCAQGCARIMLVPCAGLRVKFTTKRVNRSQLPVRAEGVGTEI